jgi:hypothetical protein
LIEHQFLYLQAADEAARRLHLQFESLLRPSREAIAEQAMSGQG